MFFNSFNPGPTATAPYVQPNTANPAANPAVTVRPVTIGNPMKLSFPLVQATDPDQGITGRGFPAGVVPGYFGAR